MVMDGNAYSDTPTCTVTGSEGVWTLASLCWRVTVMVLESNAYGVGE
jgi:hypothetical protein